MASVNSCHGTSLPFIWKNQHPRFTVRKPSSTAWQTERFRREISGSPGSCSARGNGNRMGCGVRCGLRCSTEQPRPAADRRRGSVPQLQPNQRAIHGRQDAVPARSLAKLVTPRIPPVYPSYTPSIKNTRGIRGVYRGYTRGVEGDMADGTNECGVRSGEWDA